MAAPKKVQVTAGRIDATALPPNFSMTYRLHILAQSSDLQNVADASNNAGDLAYQATVKNDEQDLTLDDHEQRISSLRIEVDDHEIRITGNTQDISALALRLTNAEAGLASAETAITNIGADYVSKSATASQSLASPLNVTTSYSVGGTKVIGARRTGWTAATGNAFRGAFDANKLQSVGTTYSQTEVNAIMGIVLEARQRIKALEDDLRAHGLIN
jgi:hypothetical protein